jgi:hypothetical protein
MNYEMLAEIDEEIGDLHILDTANTVRIEYISAIYVCSVCACTKAIISTCRASAPACSYIVIYDLSVLNKVAHLTQNGTLMFA